MTGARRCHTPDCVRAPKWGVFNGKFLYALCGPCKARVKPKQLRQRAERFVKIA